MAAEQNRIDEQLLLVDQGLQPFFFQKDEKYNMWNSLKNILMNSGSREKDRFLSETLAERKRTESQRSRVIFT